LPFGAEVVPLTIIAHTVLKTCPSDPPGKPDGVSGAQGVLSVGPA
jgi:hypothetical protein